MELRHIFKSKTTLLKSGKLSPDETQRHIDETFEGVVQYVRGMYEPTNMYAKAELNSLLAHLKAGVEVIYERLKEEDHEPVV